MHTIYSRVNNLSALLSSCLMVLLGAIALSSFLFTADPRADITITGIQVVPGNARRYRQKKQEFAFVNFNLSADLTSLFNWNTKQLFVYVSAQYTDKQGVANEVVLWDSIVLSKEHALIEVSSRNKYIFREMSRSFRDVPPANYTLKYNVMPYVGLLTYGEAGRTLKPVVFPELHQLS